MPTTAVTLATDLERLHTAHSKLVNEMRDLSPAELYKRIETFETILGYVTDEVGQAFINLERLYKEQAR
jgi:hypothetical protein